MEFESDGDALVILKPNVIEVRNGTLLIPAGYMPSQTEWDAIKYLQAEWDFEYVREEDAPILSARYRRSITRPKKAQQQRIPSGAAPITPLHPSKEYRCRACGLLGIAATVNQCPSCGSRIQQ